MVMNVLYVCSFMFYFPGTSMKNQSSILTSSGVSLPTPGNLGSFQTNNGVLHNNTPLVDISGLQSSNTPQMINMSSLQPSNINMSSLQQNMSSSLQPSNTVVYNNSMMNMLNLQTSNTVQMMPNIQPNNVVLRNNIPTQMVNMSTIRPNNTLTPSNVSLIQPNHKVVPTSNLNQINMSRLQTSSAVLQNGVSTPINIRLQPNNSVTSNGSTPVNFTRLQPNIAVTPNGRTTPINIAINKNSNTNGTPCHPKVNIVKAFTRNGKAVFLNAPSKPANVTTPNFLVKTISRIPETSTSTTSNNVINLVPSPTVQTRVGLDTPKTSLIRNGGIRPGSLNKNGMIRISTASLKSNTINTVKSVNSPKTLTYIRLPDGTLKIGSVSIWGLCFMTKCFAQ